MFLRGLLFSKSVSDEYIYSLYLLRRKTIGKYEGRRIGGITGKARSLTKPEGRSTRTEVKATLHRLLLRREVMMIMDTERLVRGGVELASQSPFKRHPLVEERGNHSWAWQPSQGALADFCFFGEEEKGRARVD